jgi:hypothetical protein
MSRDASRDASRNASRGRAGPTAFMVAAYYVPLLYLVLGAVVCSRFSGWPLAGAIVGWIYGLPPLLGRLLLLLRGRPAGTFTSRQPEYRTWWLLAQLQMPFNRLALLEELLRLLPGMYPLWLRLWGGRVSLIAFWSPGARVLDRWSIDIERGAVLGTRCLLAGHAVSRGAGEDYEIVLGAVRVEAGAVVGAGAMLGPGTVVAANEILPAGMMLTPFTSWREGRKHAGREARPEGVPASTPSCTTAPRAEVSR